MPLSVCTTLYGGAAIETGDPDVSRALECVYLPFSPVTFFDRDPSWGLHHLNGEIVEPAAYRRGENLRLVGQSQKSEFDPASMPVNDEPHIYLGQIIPHYGHFLITSLARAWFAVQHPETKFLCHSSHLAHEQFAGLPYVGKIAAALGISADRITVAFEPTVFSSMTVPGPAFIEEKLAYQAFLPPMHRLGESLLSGHRPLKNERPVYLSKSRLPQGSVAKIVNEDQIDSLMLDSKVDVVHPETLSLEQQVLLFSERTNVLGFIGSAFHTHIMSREPPRMTCVTLDGYFNSNLAMLDMLNGAEAAYLHPGRDIEAADAEGFGIAKSIVDPRSFVSDLLDAAGIAAKNYSRGRKLGQEEVRGSSMVHDDNCLPDHQGEDYRSVLTRLHAELQPKSYLEIGTLTGGTLALAEAPSISIDPSFRISSAVIGKKPLCLFYQLKSDDFFDRFDPKALLGSALDFSFLDGMHHCEFLLRDFINAERHAANGGVIALHDCLPVEIPMTDRTQNGTPPVAPHRSGWWTGDVWRTILAIKRHRPDLKILCLDAAPTGLVLISRLNPESRSLLYKHDAIVAEMLAMDLEKITIKHLFEELDVTSTSRFSDLGALESALR